MSDEGKFGFFLVGLGVGAIFGLLFAPRSGEETREFLRDRTGEALDYLKHETLDARQHAEQLSESGREYVERQRESVEGVINSGKHAFEAGKQAYREERAKAKESSRS